jgi:hypothetical protein
MVIILLPHQLVRLPVTPIIETIDTSHHGNKVATISCIVIIILNPQKLESMKKINITKYILVSLLLGVSAGVFAQDTPVIKTLPPITITSTSKTIPEKVWKNFRGYFANAQNPKWYEVTKNYLVKFMTDTVENRALFTKRGNLIYHISYGYENNLPQDLRKQALRAYEGYTITRAIKVSEADRLIWVIHLETDKKFVIVRIEDNELEEVQNLDKS